MPCRDPCKICECSVCLSHGIFTHTHAPTAHRPILHRPTPMPRWRPRRRNPKSPIRAITETDARSRSVWDWALHEAGIAKQCRTLQRRVDLTVVEGRVQIGRQVGRSAVKIKITFWRCCRSSARYKRSRWVIRGFECVLRMLQRLPVRSDNVW